MSLTIQYGTQKNATHQYFIYLVHKHWLIIKSQECICHIKQHVMTTSPVTYVTNSIQDFMKEGNILFNDALNTFYFCYMASGCFEMLIQNTGCTLTIDSTRCYLVDYNLNDHDCLVNQTLFQILGFLKCEPCKISSHK